jgi:hypothetical protein
LLQLVFPTIGLAHVVIWLIDPYPLGRFGRLLLVGCLLWYGGCFLVLALGGGRRWIAAHTGLLIFVYFLLVASAIAAEAISRRVPTTLFDPRAPHVTKYSPELGWSLRAGAGDIGQHGWRSPFYPREKSPGRYRIVCIGDSTTYGVGCSWREAWPKQLEDLLNQDAGWRRLHGITEVLNLGVLMYGPDQSLLVLKNHGLAYSPDLVIFQLCVDDFVDASFEYHWKMNFNTKMYKPFFVMQDGRLVLGRDHVPQATDLSGKAIELPRQILPDLQLRLFSVIRKRGEKLIQGEARPNLAPTKAHWPIHDSFSAEYMKARPLVWALIREMSRVSREAGARFLLTLSPHHMSGALDDPPWCVARFLGEYHEDAAAAGVRALDCVPEYFTQGGNGRFQLDGADNYLNLEGNALIARATKRRLHEMESTSESGPKR